MVKLTQQSKASDNKSNKIFHANGHTADINTKNNLATSTKVSKPTDTLNMMLRGDNCQVLVFANSELSNERLSRLKLLMNNR